MIRPPPGRIRVRGENQKKRKMRYLGYLGNILDVYIYFGDIWDLFDPKAPGESIFIDVY